MKIAQIWRDLRGAAAIEFGLTAPFFFVAVFGIVNAGILLWTQLGLQHGTEMASRCASVNAILCPDEIRAATATGSRKFPRSAGAFARAGLPSGRAQAGPQGQAPRRPGHASG